MLSPPNEAVGNENVQNVNRAAIAVAAALVVLKGPVCSQDACF